MSTGAELIADIETIVDDDGFSDAHYLNLMNECQELIAAEDPPILPALHHAETVTTVVDSHTVALPSRCVSVSDCSTAENDDIDVYESWVDLYRLYDGEEDSIKGVAIQGANLYYAPAPTTATEVTLYHYRTPVDITTSTEPSCFNGLQQRSGELALKYYAAWKTFELLEDGMEGQDTNVRRYERRYLDALASVREKAYSGLNRPQTPRNKVWE